MKKLLMPLTIIFGFTAAVSAQSVTAKPAEVKTTKTVTKESPVKEVTPAKTAAKKSAAKPADLTMPASLDLIKEETPAELPVKEEKIVKKKG